MHIISHQIDKNYEYRKYRIYIIKVCALMLIKLLRYKM